MIRYFIIGVLEDYELYIKLFVMAVFHLQWLKMTRKWDQEIWT